MREEEQRRREEEEREKARLEEEERSKGKRKAGSEDDADGDDDDENEEEEDASREVTRGAKRMRLGDGAGVDDAGAATTPSSTGNIKHTNGGFPADFFSDPSKAPPATLSDDDEDETMAQDGVQSRTQSQMQTVPSSAIDAEWAAFEQEVLNRPDDREAYENATIFAEPELVDQTAGLPTAAGEISETEAKPELTEEELRQRKEQEERELIMDRLLDEERAQEEADAKVAMLKHKLEALRKQREARKMQKKNTGP